MALRIHDPYAVPGEYRKAQLHCHTTASDGAFPPGELLRRYKDAGYSFVAITDHNRVTRCTDHDDATFLAIPGTEDTVSRFRPLGPHLGRLFVGASLPRGEAQEAIDQTARDGGLTVLCHPSWTGNLWTGTWSPAAVERLTGYHLIEVWNPHSTSLRDVARWETALAARGAIGGGAASPVWAAAVDDCHHERQFNRGWIMAKVPEVSAQALKRALTSGAFYASTGPDAVFRVRGEHLEAEFDDPLEARILDLHGRQRAGGQGRAIRYRVQGDEEALRVEGRAPGGTVWSQPFWLEPPIAGAAEDSRMGSRSAV